MKNNTPPNPDRSSNISQNAYLDQNKNTIQVGRNYSYSKLFSLRTILVILSVLVSISVAISEIYKQYSYKSGITRLVLVVQAETNQKPLSNVKVTVLSDGAPKIAYTDSSGYVKIVVPRREELNLILHKKGFQTTNLITNLTTSPDRKIILQLKSENSGLKS